MRIAVPTTGKRKLGNKVADTFSHAEHFTIITFDNDYLDVQVVPNPGKDQKRGAGPLAAKTIKDNEVELILTSELGPGLKEILSDYGIKHRLVDAGKTVREIIETEFNDRERVDSPQ